jgi:hypothetical protein
MFFDFWKSAAFGRVPGFAHVIVVRTACRWRWVWSFGETIPTGEKPKYLEKHLHKCHFVFHKTRRLGQDRTQASTVTSWQLTVFSTMKLNISEKKKVLPDRNALHLHCEQQMITSIHRNNCPFSLRITWNVYSNYMLCGWNT